MVKPISITKGQPQILLPLLFVVTISAIKDVIEDMKRHKQDSDENNRKCLVGDTTICAFTEVKWKELKIG